MTDKQRKIEVLVLYLAEFAEDITKAEAIKIKSRLKKLGVKQINTRYGIMTL